MCRRDRRRLTLWPLEAACCDADPTICFPDRGQNDEVRAAKEICAGCRVRDECLEWSLSLYIETFEYEGTKPGMTLVGFREAHRQFQISRYEPDEVAAELGRERDFVGVPTKGKDEVLAAFAEHKSEVTEGSEAMARTLIVASCGGRP